MLELADGFDGFDSLRFCQFLQRFLSPVSNSPRQEGVLGSVPHVILRVVSMLMVALLALCAFGVVKALARSSEGVSHLSCIPSAAKPVLGFYPFVLATVLVTSHPLGAVTWFPVLFIGSATYALGMCLFVARSRDLQVRRLKWHELIVMAMLGACSVMIYDLLYVVPVFTAAFIVCRCVAGGYSLRLLPRTAAAARWLALSVGFTVVFTAVRLEIASRCGIHDCYDAANVNLPRGGLLDRIVELTAARVLTGSPPAGLGLQC